MNDNLIQNTLLNYVNKGMILNYEIVKENLNECDIELILKNNISVRVNRLSNSRLPIISYLMDRYLEKVYSIFNITRELMEVNNIILEPNSSLLVSGYQYDGAIITFRVYLVDYTISDMKISYETRKNPNLSIEPYSWGVYDKISMIPSKNNTQVVSHRKINANIEPFTKNNLEDRINTLKKETHKLIEEYIKGLQVFIKV